jgi:hypothetical protein
MEYQLSARDIARFRSKIIYLFGGKVTEGDGCWLWSGAHFQTTGYALFNVKCDDSKWRPTVAHRAAWRIYVGPIPEGLQLDHLCRNRACVNPGHLEPVSQAVNIRRGEGASALNAVKTHCPQGHEYTPENTYRKPGTEWRDCRECMRERDRRRAASRRGYVPPSRRAKAPSPAAGTR